MKNETCPVCMGVTLEYHGSYRCNHSMFNNISRVHCKSCDLVYANPMPSNSELNDYNSSYFNTAHGGQPEDKVANAFFIAMGVLRYEHIKKYLIENNVSVTRVLELGPGPGFFARHWMNENPDTNYNVIETDSSCHELLREIGVNVLIESDDVNSLEDVDLVVMSHVLEHVDDPKKFIEKNTLRLRVGGVVFLEVPCQDWSYKDQDEPHLLFFDKKPLSHLVSEAGFNHICTTYHGPLINKPVIIKFIGKLWLRIRSRILHMGFIKPFSKMKPGMEALVKPIERAAISPFKAYQESRQPSWWLRLLAIKQS